MDEKQLQSKTKQTNNGGGQETTKAINSKTQMTKDYSLSIKTYLSFKTISFN